MDETVNVQVTIPSITRASLDRIMRELAALGITPIKVEIEEIENPNVKSQ